MLHWLHWSILSGENAQIWNRTFCDLADEVQLRKHLHIPLHRAFLASSALLCKGLVHLPPVVAAFPVVNEITQILGTGIYAGNILPYRIIYALPRGGGNGSYLFAHFLAWTEIWRTYIQTDGIRETPSVVFVVSDGKLSLGEFCSILCKGWSLDQDGWLLL